jgi:hypothetical protein
VHIIGPVVLKPIETKRYSSFITGWNKDVSNVYLTDGTNCGFAKLRKALRTSQNHSVMFLAAASKLSPQTPG